MVMANLNVEDPSPDPVRGPPNFQAASAYSARTSPSTSPNPSTGSLSTITSTLTLRPNNAQVVSTASDIYADWYLGDSQAAADGPRSSVDLAEDAYHRAVDALKHELGVDDRTWLQRQHSIHDVQAAVAQALNQYRSRSKASKVQEWLASCSARVMYYGQILDTFSNHHPEYVSLAWGALKFLFLSVLAHEELLAEISKAVSNLADVLPRTELHSILYPTTRMRQAVALLYAKIIHFIVEAIKWCNKGKLRHAWTAIAHPFELKFKAITDEITLRSRRVDELASAASKAEIRDLHLKIHGMSSTLNTLGLQLTEMAAYQRQQQSLHTQSLQSFQSEYRRMFQRGRIQEIQHTALLLEDTPSASESFAYCQSMRTRRRRKLPTQMPMAALAKLKAWVSDPSSSVLLAEGQGVKMSSLDFAVDFLEAVRERHFPVVWALRSNFEPDGAATPVVAILRSLISQVLELDATGMARASADVMTLTSFKNVTTAQQWLDLLERCISAVPRLFVVVDMATIEDTDDDRMEDCFSAHGFLEHLSTMVDRRRGAGLKVLAISGGMDATAASARDTTTVDTSSDDMRIATDMGRKVQRLIRQPKYRAFYKKRQQHFGQEFQSAFGQHDGE